MLKKIVTKLKPWGKEIWFAHNDKYAGKILQIKKNHRFSLQYHEKKEETQYIFSGKIKFIYGKDPQKLKSKILKSGDKIDIVPYTVHRAQALSDTIIFEVSTPELTDVVKIEDDYGRNGKGNDELNDKLLHKKLIS